MAESVDVPVAESLRNEVRRQTIAERLAHREKILNHGRNNLHEIEQELNRQSVSSPQDVTAIANKIKQSQVSHLDLRVLKESLFDNDNICAFLKVVGALQKVVGQLTGRKAVEQLEAAYICCNLALGDEHACLAVSRAAGPYLIQHLHSPNQPLQEACAWALGNAAGGSKKSLGVLQSQGLIPRLSALLASAHNDTVEAAIYALCHIIQTTSVCEKEEGLSSADLSMLASLTAPLMFEYPSSHWLLFLLSCSPSCDRSFLEQQIPVKCVKYLTENTPTALNLDSLRSVTSLVRTLANLIAEPSGRGAAMVLQNEGFHTVVQSLLQSSHTHLKNETVWLVANLFNHSSDSVRSEACAIKLQELIVGSSVGS